MPLEEPRSKSSLSKSLEHRARGEAGGPRLQAEKASILLSSVGPSVEVDALAGFCFRGWMPGGGRARGRAPSPKNRAQQEEKSGTGEPTGKKSNTHRTERPPGVGRGIEPTGGGMGIGSPKIQLGEPEGMLLCNFRARPMAPPLWARSAEIRPTKRGRASMRTGALEWAAAASAGCQPVRADRLLALPCQQRPAESTTEARCLPCPCSEGWLTGRAPRIGADIPLRLASPRRCS